MTINREDLLNKAQKFRPRTYVRYIHNERGQEMTSIEQRSVVKFEQQLIQQDVPSYLANAAIYYLFIIKGDKKFYIGKTENWLNSYLQRFSSKYKRRPITAKEFVGYVEEADATVKFHKKRVKKESQVARVVSPEELQEALDKLDQLRARRQDK